MRTKRGLESRVKPDQIAAGIRRIGSLLERNDLDFAEAEALKLLNTYPKRPDVHNILGIVYIRQEKKNRAVPHFEFAVRSEPENSHYLTNLGRLYVDLRLIELALPFLRKALAINPNLAAALLAIGKYYNDVGKAELALPYFERLHRIAPQDNGAKLALAESLGALGRNVEAGTLYRELHGVEPYMVSSLYFFSRNDAPQENATLIAQIEGLLSSDGISVSHRSTLHTSLGFIYEREHNYPLAFAHFDKANRLNRVDFDIEKYRTWVNGMTEVFTADFFRKRPYVGSPSPLPVLVVGMPRSGTTLTEQMIANHSRAGGAGELSRLGLFAQRLSYSSRRDIGKFIPSLNALDPKGLYEMGDNYVDLLKFHAPKAERVVDKLPHNFENLGLVALICRNARVIHCSRNPVDTCWSCFQNPLSDSHAYSRDLTHLGLYYREYKRLMDHWKSVLPVPVYELSYERFIDDFESEARKVIEFIGLPWDDSCLKFYEAGRTVRTLSKQQVRSPVYKSSVERWRNYEKELQPLLSALGDLV